MQIEIWKLYVFISRKFRQMCLRTVCDVLYFAVTISGQGWLRADVPSDAGPGVTFEDDEHGLALLLFSSCPRNGICRFLSCQVSSCLQGVRVTRDVVRSVTDKGMVGSLPQAWGGQRQPVGEKGEAVLKTHRLFLINDVLGSVLSPQKARRRWPPRRSCSV